MRSGVLAPHRRSTAKTCERLFASSRTSSASFHASSVLRHIDRRAEGQVSWGFRRRPVDWLGPRTCGNHSPEANSLRTSELGRFSSELKNIGQRPSSVRLAAAWIRTPLARSGPWRAETVVRQSVGPAFLPKHLCHRCRPKRFRRELADSGPAAFRIEPLQSRRLSAPRSLGPRAFANLSDLPDLESSQVRGY
jgi:hypothetical protein